MPSSANFRSLPGACLPSSSPPYMALAICSMYRSKSLITVLLGIFGVSPAKHLSRSNGQPKATLSAFPFSLPACQETSAEYHNSPTPDRLTAGYIRCRGSSSHRSRSMSLKLSTVTFMSSCVNSRVWFFWLTSNLKLSGLLPVGQKVIFETSLPTTPSLRSNSSIRPLASGFLFHGRRGRYRVPSVPRCPVCAAPPLHRTFPSSAARYRRANRDTILQDT